MGQARIANRASILQAFHTGESESQRQAKIDADETITPESVPVMVTEDDRFTRKLPAGQRVGRGFVRTISSKQKAFILRLIKERDLTNLTILPGQTLDPDKIGDMGVKGGTALIEKLLNLPEKPSAHSVKVTNQGSEKQRNFLASLMRDTNTSEESVNAQFDKISDAITALLNRKRTMPRQMPANGSTVTEGMYTVGDRIFKVQKARQSSNLYAKELIDGEFTYVSGAISIVRNNGVRMTLEQAKEYGKRTGQCCQCGRELTVKESIDAGIGPICAGKF